MTNASHASRDYARLAAELQLELVSLEPDGDAGADCQSVNELAAQLLSERICRQFGILPVALGGGVLTVAAPGLVQPAVRDITAAITGREIRFVLAPGEQIARAITRVFGDRGDDELEIPEPVVDGPPAPDPAPGVSIAAPEEVDPAELAELGVDVPWRLGRILVSRGLATSEDLAAALDEQQRTGSPLGSILVHAGVVDEHTMIEVVAEQLELPVAKLAEYEPDPEALAIIPEPEARELRCVPLAADARAVYIVTDRPLDDETRARLQSHTPLTLRPLLAPRNDIDELLRRVNAEAYTAAATTALLSQSPEDCASRVVTPAQRNVLIGLVVVIAASLVAFPIPTLITLVSLASVFYTLASLYKFKLVYSSLGHEGEIDITDEEIAALDERALPVYTILVPLYKEAAVIPKLVGGVSQLNYPKTKLDVRLLCEENDDETIDAIRELNLPPHFRLVVLPDSQPKTKPKACNFGLLQAEGEYVVIYDAEDQPDPDQLKRVVIAFRRADESVTCVQCKLNYFNQEQNTLTRWFAAEYSFWFDLLLPGLDAAGVPIPLGGTSNHFITERLVELAAWDPFNVTEDADLGIRLHKAGYETVIVDSTTLEEANSQVENWINQRSRWIKGYIQTWLVHMRHPIRLCGAIGFKSWMSFQLIIGGTFIFLLNPIFWLLTTVFLATQANLIREVFPGVVFYLAAAQLFIGNFAFVYLNVAGALERRLFSLVKYALLSPAYWGLMSVAAWKGFLQLFTNPFYWEKTQHGLDQ
jgi:cellulose synthase/poly-beta-1,6-N-acetylglucosamine synthase-like glycosyltransferase